MNFTEMYIIALKPEALWKMLIFDICSNGEVLVEKHSVSSLNVTALNAKVH